MNTLTAFSDFLAYVKNPYYNLTEQPNGTWPDRLRLMWQLWRAKAMVGFSLALLMVLAQTLLNKFTGLNFEQDIHVKGWSFVLAVVVFAPLMEEGLFRGLLKPRASHLAVVAFVLLVYLVSHTYGKVPVSKFIQLPVAIGLVGGLPLLVYSRLRKSGNLARTEQVWRAHFRLIFYLVAIGFGLVHLSNYEHLTGWHYLVAPILTLPQLFAGFYLGYVRMKYGMWYSIALHAIWNAVPASMTIAYLVTHQSGL